MHNFIYLHLFIKLYLNSEDDKNWPEPDRIGTQELEIVSGSDHISFGVSVF